MDSNALPLRRRGEPRLLRCISGAVLLGLLTMLGCRDAATAIVAPKSPDLVVFADGIWLVNSLADPGDGLCTNTECTLREAIAAANVGDRITFKSNLSGTIQLTSGTLLLEKNVTIKGLGNDLIIVSGEGTTTVFQVGTPNASVSAFFTDLTITRGVNPGQGGGIVVTEGSTLRLTRATVRNNTAARGGGVFNAGRLTIIESTISNNSATSEGGGIATLGTMTVESSTISSNVARIRGGGVADLCVLVCDDAVRFWNTTITNNAVTVPTSDGGLGGGGVMSLFGATAANTIIAGNQMNGSVAGPEADCRGNVISLAHSLTSVGGGCDFATANDVVLSSAVVFTYVLEPALGDHGGPTRTHALIERGYAVDAGSCPGANADQRGLLRPYDDPATPNAVGTCDIGAFEWQPDKVKSPK